ncbi:hypothetical protein [Brachybacterium sp. Z12]|uniref:hypothetical protein n=1 Tax=Brachybacterium sp. Z12 TaxID=2759167 RepID=UPI00223C1368|nr:hypothetical protein [Brachybacterium sp. Z12]
MPPARALDDLLDQIAAGELDVSPEQRAAAARIAEAYTDATYAPPLPAATTAGSGTTTGRPLHSGRNEAPITPSTQRSSSPATGTHPLRYDADQIVELIRTAR